jgi:hypothetical protein
LFSDVRVEIPSSEHHNWAIWKAAQTLTRMSQHNPGSVILVMLTKLLPRSGKFASIMLKALRTAGEEWIEQLTPTD